jgi:hypothetical protein
MAISRAYDWCIPTARSTNCVPHVNFWKAKHTIYKFLITNQLDALISQIYFGRKFYMFRTVLLSIIRSFSLYTQQWYTPYKFADSLHAGSGWNWVPSCSCVQAQFHPAPACQLSSIPILRASSVPSWSCVQAVSKLVWRIPLLCVQWKLLMMDRRTVRNM